MTSLYQRRVALWAPAGNMTSVESHLSELGCRVERISDFDELWNLMERDLDLVVVRCSDAPEILFWMNGVRRAGSSTPPVLTVAGSHDVEQYLKTMALGAFDCISLPVQDAELERVVCRAVEERRAEPLQLVS